MKIGIMTHHWGRSNYGQFMQHYAMQTALRNMGHAPFLINYVPLPIKKSKAVQLKKAITKPFKTAWIIDVINRHAIQRRVASFDLFHKTHFAQTERIYHSIDELKNDPPEADVYITGSDQVWNPFRNPSTLPPFFLDFGPEHIRRVSYAASWGRTALPDHEKEIISPLLEKFSAVTVREESGTDLCRQCGFENAVLAPDPTFLLDAEAYRSVMERPEDFNEKEKYILLYRLGNKDNFDYGKVFSFAKKRGLKVKYITGNGLVDLRQQIFPSVEEWLYLIDHAEYVITNSFHCCVFSMLFEKQFAVIPLEGKRAGMNQRLETLFEMTGVTSRTLRDFTILDTAYSANMERIRQHACSLLADAVGTGV